MFKTWSTSLLDTLAASYAEAGDFESAVKWATKAIEATPKDERAEFLKRLALFNKQQTFHLD